MQPGELTIQGELQAALGRVTGESPLPQGSGRTDAGVHALGQVASFALAAPIPAENLQRALNRTLPAGDSHPGSENGAKHISCAALGRGQDATSTGSFGRRSARRFWPATSTPAPGRWTWRRCNRSARLFEGEHDFLSFAATDPELADRGYDPDAEPEQRPIPREGFQIEPPTAPTVRRIFSSAWEERQTRSRRVCWSIASGAAAFCTTWCATWWERCWTWAGDGSAPMRFPEFWPPAAAPPPDRPLRRGGCFCIRWSMTSGNYPEILNEVFTSSYQASKATGSSRSALPALWKIECFWKFSSSRLGKSLRKCGAAALGAGQRRSQNGVGHAAHGLRFGQPAAAFPLRANSARASAQASCAAKAQPQRGLLAQQAGIGPHGRLQTGDHSSTRASRLRSSIGATGNAHRRIGRHQRQSSRPAWTAPRARRRPGLRAASWRPGGWRRERRCRPPRRRRRARGRVVRPKRSVRMPPIR